MNTLRIMLFLIALSVFSSFAPSEACNYAGSNMNYVKARTEEALSKEDINTARFYTYKAIKVLQTSTNRFDDCGCKEAEVNIEESLINLKAATKSTSLSGAKILLNEALQQIIDAIDALEQHEMHDSAFTSRDFAMNSTAETEIEQPAIAPENNELYRQIDRSLEAYSKSLSKVMNNVDCVEARAFATNIFVQCEQQLLKSDLSEGKKYYNLKTKEITEKALLRLGECSPYAQ